MKVKIRILSVIDGKKSVVNAIGTREDIKNGYALRYKMEDEDVTIFLIDGEVLMERKGGCYLYLPFSSKKETIGKIGMTKENFGSVSIQTEKAVWLSSDIKTEIILKYKLNFNAQPQESELRLIAERI